ncbi:MAG TPA: hypothetical protein VGC41_01540 [Kofleriaceae bacterium]
MKSLAAILLVAGCTSADGPENNVTTPSPGGQSGTGGGDTTARISGRICVLADPQLTSACEITGGGGLTVNYGANTATTAADGSFSIDANGIQTSTPITVSGQQVVASQANVSATGTTVVPVMSNDMFNQMVLSTGITTEPDTGVILASIESQQNAQINGVSATTNPTTSSGVFYDTTGGSSNWGTLATGQRGVVMVPNVSSGGAPTSMTFTDSSGGETTVDGIQVVNGGITYLDAALP